MQRAHSLRARASDLLTHHQHEAARELFEKALQSATQASNGTSKWDGIFKQENRGSLSAECRELMHSCLLNLAMVENKLGRHNQAVERCTRAANLDPDYPRAYRLRAEAHLGMRALGEAEIDLRKVLSLSPDDMDAADRLAKVIARGNREKEEQEQSKRSAVRPVLLSEEKSEQGQTKALPPSTGREPARQSGDASLRQELSEVCLLYTSPSPRDS
eukprot:TRINITY_DN8094_c0_g1_i1.p1 TRINITY_DN8094_c0_g1~~TRINITY_DN8094_c0_g1_i1.p1  ORF type:complete len:216 (-),score=42.95 TRINITY_DN8094_c0_g1_i1:149-796(-)